MPSGSATSATRRSRVSIRPPTASPASSRWVRSPAASSLVRARSLGGRLRHRKRRAGRSANEPDRGADSRRSEPLGRRVRSRRRLGDQRVQRDRFPNRLGDRRDRSDHQRWARHRVRSGTGRARSGSGATAGKSIYRVDPSTNKARAVPVGLLSPDSIAVSDAAIWVTSSADLVAVRLNPKTLRVVARVTVGLGPSDAAIAGDGSVFVPNNGDGTGAGSIRSGAGSWPRTRSGRTATRRRPPSAMSGFLSQAGGRSCGSMSADSATSQRGDRASACEHAHACGAGSPLSPPHTRGMRSPSRSTTHLRLHGRCVRPRPRAVVGRRGRRYAGRVGQPWASWMAHVAGRDRGSRVEASRGHRRAAHPLPARPCRRAPGYRDDARGDR